MTIQGNYVGGLIPSAKQVGAFSKDELIPLANGGTNRDLSEITPHAIIRAASNSTALLSTPTANGAFYATAANGAAKFGTLPIAQGGTGATTAADALANLGAVPLAGGTMTGALTTTTLTVTGGTPKVTFNETDKKASAHYVSNSRHVFQTYATDTNYYEIFRLPIVSTGLTDNAIYDVLTTKVAKDYVTAQGKSGSWHYRKYNSGYCECWCTAGQIVATTQWEAWGGIYLSQPLPRFDFPFPIYGATPNVTAHNVGGNTLGVVTASDVNSEKMYEVRCFIGTKPSSSISVVYNVHVYGRWKE